MDGKDLEQQLHEAEAKIAHLTQQLKEANRELEMLSYSISHDLRAPLRAIKGFSDAITEDYQEKLDSEGKRYLNIISTSTDQVTRLIEGILTYSRFGRQEMHPAKINVREMVQSLIAELGAKNPGRQIEYRLQTLPEAWADLNILRQIWLILMDNAIKYTRPRANAIIEIGGKTESGENIYYIKDNGVGFDMKYAEKLFGVFQRFHTEKEFEGAGIGLAVAQRLVRRHSGKIWAEARVNEGATFFFSLPVKGN